jgi:cysteine-rich repeat protein
MRPPAGRRSSQPFACRLRRIAGRNRTLGALGLAALLGIPSAARADVWVSRGPGTVSISAFAVAPTLPLTVYAAGGGGVFKTSDGGGDWSAVNTGLPASNPVQALAIDPTAPATLYAGTHGGGVFKTTDGGGIWSAVNTGLPTNAAVSALAIDPTTPATLYAGTNGGGVFKTIDGGGSWSAVNSGLILDASTSYYTALAIDPTAPATVYAGSVGGPFVLTKCGDGTIDPGEQCDDGANNGTAGDCCTGTCQFKPFRSSCNAHNPCTTGDFCTGTGVCWYTKCQKGLPCNFCGSKCTQQGFACKCG